MELPERRILMNAFFKSQFNHCSAIWMYISRSLNSKIYRLHERCLRKYITINFKILKNFYINIILSLYTTTIYMHLLLKCTKLLIVCLQQ